MKKTGAFLFFILIVLNSCFSLSTLQTPQVSDYKKGIAGIGLVGINVDHFYCCTPETYLRYGFYNNFDVGLKAGVFYFTGDIKYQLFREPFNGAIDLSFTRGGIVKLWGDSEQTETKKYSEFSPMFIIGSEKIFGGARIIYFSGATRNLYGFFYGLSIGDKFSVLPVFNIYYQDNYKDAIFVPNLGLQWKF